MFKIVLVVFSELKVSIISENDRVCSRQIIALLCVPDGFIFFLNPADSNVYRKKLVVVGTTPAGVECIFHSIILYTYDTAGVRGCCYKPHPWRHSAGSTTGRNNAGSGKSEYVLFILNVDCKVSDQYRYIKIGQVQ